MAHVPEVLSVEICQFESVGGMSLHIHASGAVATTGWSGIRLSPRFYASPPPDGLWEFDFEGHPSGGPVLDVVLPVSGSYTSGMPAWFQGAKVYAAQNSLASTDVQVASLVRGPAAHAFPSRLGAASFRQQLACFDDHITTLGPHGPTSLHMKKLRHTLALVIDGPDQAAMRRCVAEVAGTAVVADIVAAYACGGGSLSAAISALIAQLEDGLGSAFHTRINDQSEWIEWHT